MRLNSPPYATPAQRFVEFYLSRRPPKRVGRTPAQGREGRGLSPLLRLRQPFFFPRHRPPMATSAFFSPFFHGKRFQGVRSRVICVPIITPRLPLAPDRDKGVALPPSRLRQNFLPWPGPSLFLLPVAAEHPVLNSRRPWSWSSSTSFQRAVSPSVEVWPQPSFLCAGLAAFPA